jgi:hypothetical protein
MRASPLARIATAFDRSAIFVKVVRGGAVVQGLEKIMKLTKSTVIETSEGD